MLKVIVASRTFLAALMLMAGLAACGAPADQASCSALGAQARVVLGKLEAVHRIEMLDGHDAERYAAVKTDVDLTDEARRIYGKNQAAGCAPLNDLSAVLPSKY